LAAAAAFLAHNLSDFTAFLPSVGIPGAILIGLSFRSSGIDGAGGPERGGGRLAWARAPLPAAALLAFVSLSLVSARASDLVDRARAAAVDGDDREALALARRAVRLRPSDPA